MTLDPHVGTALSSYFTDGAGSALLDTMLRGGSPDTTALAIHPGGPRILDGLVAPLQVKGFHPSALHDSYETLYTHGNLGSVAILFVLASVLDRLKGATKGGQGKEALVGEGSTGPDLHGATSRILTLAFGPGVTVEWGVLERVKGSSGDDGSPARVSPQLSAVWQ